MSDRMGGRRVPWAALVFSLLMSAGVASVPVLAVEQTGELHGIVRDNAGAALPGATVTLTSSNLQGQRAAMTDANGRFSFLTLPPGLYTIAVSAPEQVTRTVPNIAVNIGRASQVDVKLFADQSLTEEVTVTGRQTLVDTRRTQTQETFDAEYLSKTQTGSAGRDYLSVIGNAAGAVGDGNTQVRGSTLGENLYLVDGVDSTDPVTGTFGTNYIFDAIEEVQLQTGGFAAEFGRATGGIVNVVTKSGGNEFSGSLDVRYRNESMIEKGRHFDPDGVTVDNRIAEATFGGPIIRDKLWFFVAGSYTKADTAPAPGTAVRGFEGRYYLGKLTWQPTVNHRLSLQITADPATIDNDDTDTTVLPEATTYQEQGSRFVTARYLGALSPQWTIEAQAAHYNAYLNAYPQSRDFSTPGHLNFLTGYTSVNALNAQYSDRDRNQANVSVTWVPEGASQHRVKAGVDMQWLQFDAESYTPSGESWDVVTFEEGDVPLIYHVDVRAPKSRNKGVVGGYFLQDEWRIHDRVTLNAGLRYDAFSYENDVGQEVFRSDLLQPRVGAAYDFRGDGKTVLKGSYSVFAHPSILSVPSIVNSRVNGTDDYINETIVGLFIGAPDPEFDFNGDGTIEERAYWRTLGGPGGSVIARGGKLDATNVKEYSLALERSLSPTTDASLTLVRRNTDEIIEDTFDPDSGIYVVDNLPGLDRRYVGAEFRVRSRLKKLFLDGSYTWARARGNVEYTQSLGSDFDFPEHSVNRYGYLSTDVRHSVKLAGSLDIPWNMQFGFNGYWNSGFPFNYVQTPLEAGYGKEFLEPRGSRRLPDSYRLDLDLRKRFVVGPTQAALILTVLNVFDTEQVIAADEFSETFAPTQWQTPRRYEVGARISF